MRELDCLDLYFDAAFYDEEFAERKFEIPFYQRLAERCKGPILEVACGTGRLTIPLAVAGHQIKGLDVSEQMLQMARQKAQREGVDIEWFRQDCRAMELGRQFHLIFSATNSMQHLLDTASVEAFLRSAADHIQPGGLLLIDVMNPDVRRLARGPEDRYLQKTFKDTAGDHIEVEAASRYKADDQILHFDLTYRRGHEVIKEKSVNMRCFFPQELMSLCNHNGWHVSKRCGDYDDSPFTAASPKQLLLCELGDWSLNQRS